MELHLLIRNIIYLVLTGAVLFFKGGRGRERGGKSSSADGGGTVTHGPAWTLR